MGRLFGSALVQTLPKPLSVRAGRIRLLPPFRPDKAQSGIDSGLPLSYRRPVPMIGAELFRYLVKRKIK